MSEVPLEAYGATLIAMMGGWVVVASLRRGVTFGEKGVQVSRDERPTRFWFDIIGWAMISLACLGFAVWKFSTP